MSDPNNPVIRWTFVQTTIDIVEAKLLDLLVLERRRKETTVTFRGDGYGIRLMRWTHRKPNPWFLEGYIFKEKKWSIRDSNS